MIKAIWAGNSPYSKFLITVGIILLCAVLFTLLSTMTVMATYGINMMEMQNLLSDPETPMSISILKIVQTFSAIGTFLIPPFILAYLFDGRPSSYLSLDKKSSVTSFVIVTIAMLAATPFINFLGEINSHMHLPGFMRGVEEWMKEAEDKAALLTKAFLKMDSFGDFIFNMLMIALIPAVGEELVFRGIVQKLFHQLAKNIHVGVWVAAILFSAMHMQFYGFLPRMVLGVMLGYMLVWSGNLWLPILGHFVNNAGAVIFIYLFQHGYSSIDPDKIGTESDFASVAFSIVVTAGLLIMLYKRNEKRIIES
jgi:uncharacterized protein